MTKTHIIIDLTTYPLTRRTPNGDGQLTTRGSKIDPFPKGMLRKKPLRSADVGKLEDLNKKQHKHNSQYILNTLT